jgi:hypothetical protein
MFLSEFNFKLIWAPGVKNIADAPSCCPDFVPKKGDEAFDAQLCTLLKPHITEHLFSDDSTLSANAVSIAASSITTTSSDLLERIKTAHATDEEALNALKHEDSDFSSTDSMVFHKGRLFVPESFRARHDALAARHPGRTRMLNLVQRDYSWPGVATQVRQYVAACDVCLRIKHACHLPYSPLQPLEMPMRPWTDITMDFIVKLPLLHGHDSVLDVCNCFTRSAHFIPCNETIDVVGFACLYLDRVFRHHGLPDRIVPNCGALFTSHFWTELTRLLQVETRTSTAYHPRTDGLTKRTNQTLETYLRAYCSYQQSDWVDYLPMAEFSFNNLVNESIRMTPFFVSNGQHPAFKPCITTDTSVPAAANLASCLELVHAKLRAKLQHAQEIQKHNFDRSVLDVPVEFKPGRPVWLLHCNIKTTRSSIKLEHRCLRPYPIVRRICTRSFELKLPDYLR